MPDGALSFAVRVDSRGLDRTVKGAIRDIERVQRVALVRAASMVRGYLLKAISNNGNVVFKKTGEQIVPALAKKSELHDVLHGTGAPPVLSKKESVLLRVNPAAGTADVGWGGGLAAYVQRWQDGTVGGERRLGSPKARSRIYAFLARRGFGVSDLKKAKKWHEKAKIWLDSQIRPQPKREFVEPVAAFVGPRFAHWFEGAIKSAIERRNDRYLDSLREPDVAVATRRDARLAAAAARTAERDAARARRSSAEYQAERARHRRELADARNARRRAARAGRSRP